MNKEKAVFIAVVVLLACYLAGWWHGLADRRKMDLAAIRVKVEAAPGSMLRLLPPVGDGSGLSLPVKRSASTGVSEVEAMQVSVPSPLVPSPPVALPLPGPYLRYTVALPRIETLLQALQQPAVPQSQPAPPRRTEPEKPAGGEGRRRLLQGPGGGRGEGASGSEGEKKPPPAVEMLRRRADQEKE